MPTVTEITSPPPSWVDTLAPEALRPFLKLAREKVWPAYQKQYSELWDLITAAKV